MEFDVTIEIPKGERNKYEVDHKTGRIKLDRTLFTATQYPADYGFIDDTLGQDGDPLDVMVLVQEPTFPGCLIRCRAIGMFRMTDEKGPDDKVIAVPSNDPRLEHLRDIHHMNEFHRLEIQHFFERLQGPGARQERRRLVLGRPHRGRGGDRPVVRARERPPGQGEGQRRRRPLTSRERGPSVPRGLFVFQRVSAPGRAPERRQPRRPRAAPSPTCPTAAFSLRNQTSAKPTVSTIRADQEHRAHRLGEALQDGPGQRRVEGGQERRVVDVQPALRLLRELRVLRQRRRVGRRGSIAERMAFAIRSPTVREQDRQEHRDADRAADLAEERRRRGGDAHVRAGTAFCTRAPASA